MAGDLCRNCEYWDPIVGPEGRMDGGFCLNSKTKFVKENGLLEVAGFLGLNAPACGLFSPRHILRPDSVISDLERLLFCPPLIPKGTSQLEILVQVIAGEIDRVQKRLLFGNTVRIPLTESQIAMYRAIARGAERDATFHGLFCVMYQASQEKTPVIVDAQVDRYPPKGGRLQKRN